MESFQSDIYKRCGEIVRSWSLKERIGQLFLLAFPGKDPEKIKTLIEEYNIGGCYLSQDNAETFAEAASLTGTLQGYTRLRSTSVPLLLGVDQEGAWGVLIPESTIGPGNLALGAADDPDLTSTLYRIYGQEMRSVGFNALFAPCADVNSNPLSPIIGTRSFGQYPQKVKGHVVAAIQGARSSGIIATAKHFPGHGSSGGDTHREIPAVDKSLDDLLSADLIPFRAAVEAGVDIVMTSHIRYPKIDPENPATLSPRILKEILRDILGFEGIILSDSMNMGAIRKYYSPQDSVFKALLAGVDMLMLSEEHYDHSEHYLENQLTSIHHLLDQTENDKIHEDILNETVTRVVAFKLQKCAKKNQSSSILSKDERTKIEQRAAEKALTVIRDENNRWPLQRGRRIVCINASPRSSYHNIVNKRGIGPNQQMPAFDMFRQELKRYRADAMFLSHEEMDREYINERLKNAEYILVITEDYPLPGEDFSKQDQIALVKDLSRKYPDKLVVLGLCSPYELVSYPDVKGYVSAFSSRLCSAKAAAKAALGLISCPGVSPVDVSRLRE